MCALASVGCPETVKEDSHPNVETVIPIGIRSGDERELETSFDDARGTSYPSQTQNKSQHNFRPLVDL